jgi:hypothetical protein
LSDQFRVLPYASVVDVSVSATVLDKVGERYVGIIDSAIGSETGFAIFASRRDRHIANGTCSFQFAFWGVLIIPFGGTFSRTEARVGCRVSTLDAVSFLFAKSFTGWTICGSESSADFTTVIA